MHRANRGACSVEIQKGGIVINIHGLVLVSSQLKSDSLYITKKMQEEPVPLLLIGRREKDLHLMRDLLQVISQGLFLNLICSHLMWYVIIARMSPLFVSYLSVPFGR